MGVLTVPTEFVATLWSSLSWRGSFVLGPLIWMTMNVFLAVGLSMTTVSENPDLADKGLRMISLLSSASISIVTLTFSLTVLSVQIASQSYTPRLLDDFIKDPVPKIVIAVNLGAFAYCFTLNYFIDGTDIDVRVSYVAIHFLSLHCVLVLVTFVNFIHLFIDGFRVEKILSRAANASLMAAKAVSAGLESDLFRKEQPDVPTHAYKVMADRSGYITQFNLNSLVLQAKDMDICVRYHRQIGEFVNEGTLQCYVWDAKTREDDIEVPMEKRVLHHFKGKDSSTHGVSFDEVHSLLAGFVAGGVCVSKKRTSDMDMTLGIQQLTDIAVRALSPGVNDPHTATQCMDVLSSLFATLATMELSIPNARDDDENLRLFAPRRSFSYLLSLLDGIRRYGKTDVGVCRRGLRLFGDLGAILTRDRRLDRVPAVLAQLEQWIIVSRQNFPKESPELASLEEMYDYLLQTIKESKHLQLKSDESVAKDQQDMDVVHQDKDSSNADDLQQKSLINDFIHRLTRSSDSMTDS